MVLLWLLGLMMLPICTISGIWDQHCIDNCSCCIERKCGPNFGWSNVCKIGCIDGHRGPRCYEKCQYVNCKSCGFLDSDDTCRTCYDGYYLGPNEDCTSLCPSNCKSCTSNTRCTECKEGFYDKGGSTTCPYAHCPANCDCYSQGDCISCKPGYYDTSTSCNEQCPVNCLMCESEVSCNECKHGFYNGYTNDNAINLRLDNCTYECRDNCIQCESYNNCSKCINGKYGQICQKDCSVGCKGRTCHFDSGQCTCTIGFTGDKCMKCIDGKFGLFCNVTCPKFCKGGICERTSGDCTGGCINENMSGNTCYACNVGKFDELCDKMCPDNCKDIRCERYSGNCSDGCIRNFNGTKCYVCVTGKFGTNCDSSCPAHCAGNVCERDSGACFDCNGNFQGETCDECNPGYYGANCDIPCSPHCSSSICNGYNGTCVNGCKTGYSGDKCCVMSQYCSECETNSECKQCVPGFFKISCNETCLSCCGNACDISTGECIISKEEQEQKDAPNSGLVAALVVLGFMFTLVVAANIVLIVLVLLKKITVSRGKHVEREPTYENQLKSVDEQFPRPTRDGDN